MREVPEDIPRHAHLRGMTVEETPEHTIYSGGTPNARDPTEIRVTPTHDFYKWKFEPSHLACGYNIDRYMGFESSEYWHRGTKRGEDDGVRFTKEHTLTPNGIDSLCWESSLDDCVIE